MKIVDTWPKHRKIFYILHNIGMYLVFGIKIANYSTFDMRIGKQLT